MSAQEITTTTGKIIAQGVCDVSQINIGERFRTDNELDPEFIESIQTKGILQSITVDQHWNLISGGRRVAAATQLGIKVPYLQRETDGELDLRECELIENAFRKDFGWLDRNRLVARIHSLMEKRHGNDWNQRKTADLLNKSVGGINRHLALIKAIGHFPDLAKCETEDAAVKLFRRLTERVIVKDLVEQQKTRTAIGETKGDGENSEADMVEIPIGIRLTRHADNHYRVGDAFEGLQEIINEVGTVNASLVEIDPPYGIDITEQKKGDLNRGIGEYNEVDQSEYPTFLRRLMELCHKATPKNCRFIIWFGIEWYNELTGILLDLGMDYDIIPGIWHKPTGQTAAPDLYLARSYETFLVAWKGEGVPLAKRGRSNVFSFNPEPHSQKYHPTQRPRELMEELLLTFGWPGSIVLVPFLGSGATIRAAYKCGMHAFGWDLSGVYKEGFLARVEQDVQDGYLNEIRTVV